MWDFPSLIKKHSELMAEKGIPRNAPEYWVVHQQTLNEIWDEACFLHYQGLFYPYRKEFLETEYWDWVKMYVLDAANYHCEMNGGVSHGARGEGIYLPRLEVHHMNYWICGQEHLYINDLIALCGNHHDHYHRDHKYDNWGVPPLLKRSSSPGSLPCAFLHKHLIWKSR